MKSKRFFALLFVLAVFCLCASACNFDFPFPMGTTAPTTTEAPVTTTEPPVTTTEPPVTTTEPPVTTLPPAVTAPITFTGSEKEYDGEALPYGVVGLPAEGIEGVSYSIQKDGEPFAGTELIDAGVYTVTAIFTVSEGYQPFDSLTATFTIYRKTVDISGVTWNYSTPFKNDGTLHTVLLIGLPDKISVDYSGTCGASKTGTYTAIATLTVTDKNYQLKEPSVTLSLTWKIDNGGWTGDIL